MLQQVTGDASMPSAWAGEVPGSRAFRKHLAKLSARTPPIPSHFADIHDAEQGASCHLQADATQCSLPAQSPQVTSSCRGCGVGLGKVVGQVEASHNMV